MESTNIQDESRMRAEARFRVAVESAPSGMIMTDAAGTIVMVNREAERLFGYARDEILGQPVEKLIPMRFGAEHPEHRAGFSKEPSVRRMGAGRILYGLRKDGTEIPVEIGLNPIETDEGLLVLSAIVDISARKRAEDDRRELEEQLRQAQKMEAVGTLAGGIAHDFNNILGAIIGYAELARIAIRDRPEPAADIEEILKAAERGKRLVERMLAFSRRHETTLQPLRIPDTVSEAVKLLRAALPAAVEIETRIDGETPAVLGDSTAIHQVLMNLGTNAAHAMPGGGRITVSVDSIYIRDSIARSHPDLHEGPYALIAVRDTGHGMDRQTLGRVFEPFFTTKSPGVGTGLGLAVVHNIMKEHQGAVLIDSIVSQGTTVKCFFPAVASEVHDQLRIAEVSRRGKGQRILYVDDEPLLARVGLRRLETLGYRVTAFTDSRESLEQFRLQPDLYDMVVTDYWMPQMTGLDLSREIHRIRPDLPIVMLTGFLDELAPATLQACGIRRVLNKPATAQDLASAVHQVFELHES